MSNNFINRSCADKVRYTLERAGETAKKWKKKQGIQFRIYHCGICNGYHLTTLKEPPIGQPNIILPPTATLKKINAQLAEKNYRCKAGHETTEEYHQKTCPTCIEAKQAKEQRIIEKAKQIKEKAAQAALEEYRKWAEKQQ